MPSTEDSREVTGNAVLIPLQRRSLVQKANVVMTLAVAGLSAIKWLALGNEFLPVAGIIMTLLGVCNGIYLAVGGRAMVAARLLVAAATLGLIFGSFTTGGLDGPVVLLAPLIPVLSFLLIGARAGWIAAIAMALSLLLVLMLHLVDAVPPSPHTDYNLFFGRFVALVSTGLMSTWVIWAFAVTATALGQRNEVLANTDHLTSIANRRFSEKTLDQEILRARRSERDLSLIIADVDFFKRYNDVNGHQAGDECLKRVAGVMGNSARRPGDFVGRYGGEEFIAILPETDSEGALTIAESIRQALLDEQMPYEPGKPEMVSMTFGVTSFAGNQIESSASMIALADRALYRGKEQGRNTVVMNLPAENPRELVSVAVSS